MLHSKRDFQKITMDYLMPLKKHYSEGCARLSLGSFNAKYPKRVAELEAWARPLWAIASYIKGGGQDEEFERIYRQGLINGTDPNHADYWGHDESSHQWICEMVSIAFSLCVIPEVLWDPLTEAQKENVARWLDGSNKRTVSENNWLFFPVFINLALKRLGRPYNEEKIAYSLSRIEDFYIGNGWYMDGITRNIDYYVGFAFNFYGLLFSTLEPDSPYSKKYRQRAMEFGPQFIYWFADSGEGIPYGRSLTYRFAQIAYFSACLYAGIHPFPVPVIKGIICRHMEYWLRQPIVDNGGVMTVGYCYNDLIMSENYNAPGSPYWCMKTMLLLALPDDHEFWSADAAPMPKLDALKALPDANMMIRRTADDVTAAVSGLHSVRFSTLGHTAEKYSKFVYSAKFGFSVMKSNALLSEIAPDSMLVFEVEGKYFIRENCLKFERRGDVMVSFWSPFAGIDVVTSIALTEYGHRRTHKITSSIPCKVYDCGFAVEAYTAKDSSRVSDVMAEVASVDSVCQVIGGKGMIIDAAPNTNLVHTNTRIPAVTHDISIGETTVWTDVVTTPECYPWSESAPIAERF